MLFDSVEWDEANLDHATRRATAAEVEQTIANADSHTRSGHAPDRVMAGPAPTGVAGWSSWRN